MSTPVGQHHRVRRPSSRLLGLLVVALLVGGALVDRRADSAKAEVAPIVGAAPASAVSSAWYCPLLVSTAADSSTGAVIISNPQNRALTGTISFVDNGGGHNDVAVNVAPRSRQDIHPTVSANATAASALVSLAGGGAAVEQYVRTAAGQTATPCASNASKNWYFADGSTESGASLQIGLFNPFTENAIVDASFATSEGVALPAVFQGVVVPPKSMVVLDVSGNVRRRDYVATTIALRSGRVAAAQLQTGVIGAAPVVGYTVGAPSLSTTQYAPDIETLPGHHSNLSIYNPGDVESEVEVSNYLDKGSAQPFVLHVPASGRALVSFDAEKRIPAESRMGAVVRVTNGVPVASQLTTTAVAPSAVTGGGFVTLPSNAAKQWVLASNGIAPGSEAFVYVFNPGAKVATVQLTLTGDGNSSMQTPVKVNPGERYTLHVNDLSPNALAGVVATSDEDIVVGREVDALPGPNLSVAPAIPVRQ